MQVSRVTSLAELYQLKNISLALFTGSKDASGKSWCPDCVSAEPNIQKMIGSDAFKDAHLAICSVPRDEWKSTNNPYKADKKLKVMSVPTLLVWDNPAVRLAESQLLDYGSVEMLGEEL